MCLYPKLITNPKYKSNKKNGGNVPPMKDPRVSQVPIGCQQCIECKKQKSREWQIRLLEHIKTNNNGKFITLTFSDEAYTYFTNRNRKSKQNNKKLEILQGYDTDNKIATDANRLFLERWRKKFRRTLQHWSITELGHEGTHNIHIHGIYWTNETADTIESIWQYGHCWKGTPIYAKGKQLIRYDNYVNEKTINYITKYITKTDTDHKLYNAIILTSPGIGNNYTKKQNGDWKNNKYKEKNTNELYRNRQGYKIALPIYYRNKIYTEQEKEDLWLQKLDKQQRWILGNKIDISQGEEEYYKALKYAQQTNKELGYNDNNITWEKQQYEREQRIIKQQQRIINTKNKNKNKIQRHPPT